MRTLAILPVKSFSAAKQRLSEALAAGSRGSLAQAMVSDVLAALGRSRRVDAIAVVTGDRAARALGGVRVTVLRDDVEAGQSAAAQIGIRHAIAAGFDRVLLVPGDTPLLDPREVDLLLERAQADRIPITIVADRHGTGTNALVLSPPGILVPSFGPDSLARHVQSAGATGLPHRVERAPSLEHDVDTPDDLAVLWNELDAERGRAQRTRGALRQLERSGALRQLDRSRASAEPERPGAPPVAAPR